MSTIYGADVAELRALATQFERTADQLDHGRMAVGNAIQISAWVGPFASRFRIQWESEHSRRILSAVAALRTVARQLRANADGQERASAADGASDWNASIMPQLVDTLWGTPGREWASPSVEDRAEEALRAIDRLKEETLLGTGFDVGDAVGLIPLLGSASDILGAADQIAQGQFPWHEGADLVGGALRGADNPIAYGVGVNLSLWADVAEQATKVDWSPKGLQDAWNGMFTLDGWKEVGKDLTSKLPAILVGDFAWW